MAKDVCLEFIKEYGKEYVRIFRSLFVIERGSILEGNMVKVPKMIFKKLKKRYSKYYDKEWNEIYLDNEHDIINFFTQLVQLLEEYNEKLFLYKVFIGKDRVISVQRIPVELEDVYGLPAFPTKRLVFVKLDNYYVVTAFVREDVEKKAYVLNTVRVLEKFSNENELMEWFLKYVL